MLVIAKDAERRLVDTVKQFSPEKGSTQRCFHLTFSESNAPRSTLINHFLRLFQELLDAYEAKIFLCRDKDIFVLMPSLRQHRMNSMIADLEESLEGHHTLRGMIYLYENKINWPDLMEIAEEKRKAAEHKGTHHLDKDTRLSKAEIAGILSTLPADLVGSIGARRAGNTTPTILIVDDDQLSRTLARNVLSKGHHVIAAPDGLSAITSFVDFAPDIVFLDIGLPDLNGHRVLEILFVLDTEAYVIMFSSLKSKDNILKALEIGAQGFVGKPFTQGKLLEYVTRCPHITPEEDSTSTNQHSAA